jgi:hypothetical protein
MCAHNGKLAYRKKISSKLSRAVAGVPKMRRKLLLL